MTNHELGILFGAIALLALGLTGLFAFYDLIAWTVTQATKWRTRRRVR